jgi:hypothetical protein
MKVHTLIREDSISLAAAPYVFDINPKYKKKQFHKTKFRLYANGTYEKKQMRVVVKALQKSGLFKLRHKRKSGNKVVWEFRKV